MMKDYNMETIMEAKIKTKTIRSCYESQDEILNSIQKLYCPDGFECDLTYGNGVFWKNIDRPKYCFDINPTVDFIQKGDSTNIPLKENTLNNIVFDPPFLTYIKNGKDYKNGGVIMSKRFGGYYSYEDLETHYWFSLKEMCRVLKKNGKVIFKCQDIIHNHKMHCTHNMIINMADSLGFRLCDMFILVAKHRLPMPQENMPNFKQKHARVFHSYFLILEKYKLVKKELNSDTLFDSSDWE